MEQTLKRGSLANRLVSLICSVLLVFSCWGTPLAYAVESSDEAPAQDSATASDVAATADDYADAADEPAGDPNSQGQGATLPGEDNAGEAADAAEEGAQEGAADAQDSAVDITSEWRKGALTLSEQGTYYLSDDVSTDGTLTVAAPAGETITIDFRGHDVLVAGNVFAGIDASTSKGTVVITDTERKGEPIDAKLVVQANKIEGGVVGIQMNVPESSKNAETGADATPSLKVDNLAIEVHANTRSLNAEAATDAIGIYVGYGYKAASDTLAATVGDVSITAQVQNISVSEDKQRELAEDYGEKVISSDDSGLAGAIYTTTKGLKLTGSITTELSSKGSVCDIYSTADLPLYLGSDFSAEEPLLVYTNGNKPQEPFARISERFEDADALAAQFVDATEQGNKVVAQDGLLQFAPASADTEDAAEEAGDGADADASQEADSDAADEAATNEEAATEGADDEAAAQDTDNLIVPRMAKRVSAMKAQALNVVSLNDTWEAVTGTEGNQGAYVILEPGVYELTDDLDMGTSHIEIGRYDKATTGIGDMSVEIRLNGHTLSQTSDAAPNTGTLATNWIGNAGYGMIQVNRSVNNRVVNLTVNGASSDGKNGAMKVNIAGNYGHYGAVFSSFSSSISVAQKIKNVDYQATVTVESYSGNYVYGIQGIGAGTSSSLEVSDTTITIDGEKPTNSGSPSYYGVNKTNGMPATISDVEVTIASSQAPRNAVGFVLSSGKAEENTIHNAKVAVKAPNRVAVTSTSDFFGGLANCSATVTGTLDVTIEGGSPGATQTNRDKAPVGVGVYPSGSTTVLDCDYSFTSVSGQNAAFAVASANTDGRYLVFGPNFMAMTELPEVVCNNNYFTQSAAIYEDAGFWLGKFAETPTPAQVLNLQQNITSLAGSTIKVTNEGVTYEVTADDAVAELLQNGQHVAYYKTMNTSLRTDATKTSGATVKLLKDTTTSSDVFDPNGGEKGDTLTFDVNGHKAVGVRNSYYSGSELKIIDSSSEKTGMLSNSTTVYTLNAISSAETTVVVEGVPIKNTQNGTTAPIYIANGTSVILNNVDVAKEIINNTGAIDAIYLSGSASKTSSLTMNGGSVKVSSTGGANANFMRGIDLNLKAAGTLNVTLNDTEIVVDSKSTSQNNKAIGIDAASNVTAGTVNLTVNGNEETPTKISATSPKGVAIGVISAGNVKTVINNCDLSAVVTDSSTATTAVPAWFPRATAYADKLSGWSTSATISQAATDTTFGGTMKFTGGFAYKSTLALASDFVWSGLADVADKSVKVANSNLIPVASADTDADLTELAKKLIGASAAYQDCEAVTFSDSNKARLRWNAAADDPVAHNVTADFDYPNLDSAFNSVSDGDEIQLLKDITLEALTKVESYNEPTSFTFDLNGHTLNLGKLEANTRNVYAGIELTGGARVTFVDTADEKGGINVTVGSTAIVGNSSNNINRSGIMVSGNEAGVTLDGVRLDVTIAGKETVGYSKLYGGIVAQGANSTVTLKGATTLNVSWNAEGNNTNGAPFSQLYGVYSSGTGDGAAVSVGPEVTVKVSTDGQAYETGGIVDSTSPTSVVEIAPQEGTAMYDEIQQKFAAGATFDALEDNSTGYGNKIYWWTGRLDDGTVIIAYSDAVPDDKVGDPEYIVAKHIFTQTKYDQVVTAAGVYLAAAFAGTAEVQGSYEVQAPYGNAYGLYAGGRSAATATVGTASFNVQGGSSNYRQLEGKLNVTSVVDGLDPVSPCYYPYSSRNSAPNYVERATTEAYGVYSPTAGGAAEAAKIIMNGKVKSSVSGRESTDIRVTEPFYLSDGFGLQDGADKLGVLMAARGEEQNTQFGTFAKGEGDYTPTAADATCFADVADEYSSGTGDEGLVWGEGFTVRFIVDDTVVQENSRLVAGQTVSLPTKAFTDKYDSTGASTYKFLGWSKTDGAEAINTDDGDLDASATTFNATEEATYYAVYEKVVKEKTIIVTGLKDSEGVVLPDVTFTVKNGETLVSALTRQGLATPTTAQEYGNNRFVGWLTTGPTSTSSGSISNGTTLFDPRDIWSMKTDFSTTQESGTFPYPNSATSYDSIKLWAVYRTVTDTQAMVTFKNGNLLKVWVGNKGASAKPTSSWGSAAFSIDSWFSISGNASNADTFPTYASNGGGSNVTQGANVNGTLYKFAGWYAGYSSNPLVTSDEPATHPFGDTSVNTNKERKYRDPLITAATEDTTYTAKFTTSTRNIPVTIYGYVKSGDGYEYKKLADLERPEGTTTLTDATDPYISDVFVWEGQQYEFLGWSVRQSDQTPLYAKGTPLPALTGTSSGMMGNQIAGPTYYAIYSTKPVSGTVEFFNGSTRYATAYDQSGDTSLDDAFASLDMDDPTSGEDGKILVGWSSKQDATSPEVSKTGVPATVGSIASDAGLYMPFTIQVYAVYSDVYRYNVTFYEVPEADGADTANRSVIKGPIGVPEGTTVASTGSAPTNPVRGGSYFQGWNTAVDGSGTAFSLDETAVNNTYDLYAVFKPIEINAGDSGVEANASAMYPKNEDGESVAAQSVSVNVAKASKRDGNLTYTGHSDYTDAGAYSLKVTMTDANGAEQEMTDGFNVLTLKLPVSKQYMDAGNQMVVRWLKADGTVGTSAAKTPVANDDGTGYVEISIADYAPSAMGGNVAVFAKPTDQQVVEAKAYDNALEALENAYRSYREADYRPEDWRTLEKAYEDGKQAILDSATINEVEQMTNAAMQNMAAVPKDDTTELERAKSLALDLLAATYSSYDREDYDSVGWAKLKAAYNEARTAVQGASKAADATKAGADGVAAMEAVATKGATADDPNSSGGSSAGLDTQAGSGAGGGSLTGGSSGVSGGLANTTLGSSGLSNTSLSSTTTRSSFTDSMVSDGMQTATAKDGSLLIVPQGDSALSVIADDANPLAASAEAGDGAEAASGGFFGWVHDHWILFWILVVLALLAIAAGVVAAMRKRGSDSDADQAAEPAQDGEITFA